MEQNINSQACQGQGTGLERYRKTIDGKKLRFGYTTGSGAAAAAKAAAYMLLARERAEYVDLVAPKGIRLHLEVLDVSWGAGFVSCAIEKDAGDDPDVTNGAWVYAKVSKKEEEGIAITGGAGVGIVTKPGLEQPPGAYAINATPRKMIEQELLELCKKHGYAGGLTVEVSVPQGEELATRTFNPKLGITGGISILGTTGIVEPMSEAALISSIRLELNQQIKMGRKNLVAVPGNYGQEFLKQREGLSLDQAVKCSNYIGEAIDMAAELGAERLLFVSHIGKFIKVAGGIFQTHSRNADARLEILTANAVLAGVRLPLLSELMQAVTTEEAIRLLEEEGALERTMAHVMERIQLHLDRRSQGRVQVGAIVFSSEYGRRNHSNGELGNTKNAEGIIEQIWKEQMRRDLCQENYMA